MNDSVDCATAPSAPRGSSSGEMSVSTTSSSVSRASPSNSLRAAHSTRNLTSVLGMLPLGLYMLMWSPL